MKQQTLKALKGSIAKWRSIVAGTGSDRMSDNCPLCELFAKDCRGCPVKRKTRKTGCAGSPWMEWAATQGSKGRLASLGQYRANTPELKKLAKAELSFLRSLLPSTKGP